MQRDAVPILAGLYETPDKLRFLLSKARVTTDAVEDLGSGDSASRWSVVAGQLEDAGWEALVQAAMRQYPYHRGWRAVPIDAGDEQRHARLAAALPEGEIELQAELDGRPELVDARWFNHGVNAIEAVCLIATRQGSGTGVYCHGGPTGTMIVTNHHVIHDVDEAKAATAEFRSFSVREGRDVALESVNLTPPARGFWSRPEDDLTFIALTLEARRRLDDRFGVVRLRPAGAPRRDMAVLVVQHPGGSKKQVALKGSVTDIADQETRVRYSSHTARGSSGGLVVDMSWRPVAIHHLGKAGEYNQGVHIDVVTARADAFTNPES